VISGVKASIQSFHEVCNTADSVKLVAEAMQIFYYLTKGNLIYQQTQPTCLFKADKCSFVVKKKSLF